jgi:CRISPR system Cascade subunit CasD
MRGLALRLRGPMQSWGGPVAGEDRPSLDVPSRSGVVGVVAAALGWDRRNAALIAALGRALALAVRVDAAGQRGIDFHTSEFVPKANGKLRKDPVVSRRGYLYDASFVALLVELEPPPVSLEAMAAALVHPRFVPYLGRKACPPASPVLAAATVLEAETWEGMLARIPIEPEPRAGAPMPDLHVDARLAPHATERPLRVRDVPTNAPRFFAERVVYPVAFEPTRHAPPRSAPAGEDTVTPWFD